MLDTSFTFVCVAEGASEGAAHSDVSVLQVLQHQILHRDRLPVNLETLALVPGDGARQDQQLSEQEHMQLLRGHKHTETITTTALIKSSILNYQQRFLESRIVKSLVGGVTA